MGCWGAFIVCRHLATIHGRTVRNKYLITIALACNNLETILLNSAHKYMTMEDLDYGTWLSTHDSYLKTKDINFNQPSSSEEFKGLLDEYKEWMEANGAQPNDDEEEIAMGMIETMSDFFGFEL